MILCWFKKEKTILKSGLDGETQQKERIKVEEDMGVNEIVMNGDMEASSKHIQEIIMSQIYLEYKLHIMKQRKKKYQSFTRVVINTA